MFATSASSEDSPYYGVITMEFDDSGELWSDGALTDIGTWFVDMLEGPVEPEGLLVVIYAHGWKNDASPRNAAGGNLHEFERLLKRVSDDWQSTVDEREKRPVIGIYMAWRGDSIALPEPIKGLSYFDRNAATDRIASPAATGTLYTIMRLFRGMPGSRVVVIGHSMGAKIVERALLPAYQTALIEHMRNNDEADLPFRPPADLVLLVNPASPAIEAKKAIDFFNRLSFAAPDEMLWPQSHICMPGVSRWAPLIVSITSDTDQANGRLFPFGNYLATMFRRTRDYEEWGLVVDDEYGGIRRPTKDEIPQGARTFKLPSQRFFLTRTAGFAPVLHSHKVSHTVIARDSDSVAPCSADLCAAIPSVLGFADGRNSIPAGSACFLVGKHQFVIQELPFRYNATPYWIMRVPDSIVNGHSGIFGEGAYAFVRGLIAGAPKALPLDDTEAAVSEPYP